MKIDNARDLLALAAEEIGRPHPIRWYALELGINEDNARQIFHRLRKRGLLRMRSKEGQRGHVVVEAVVTVHT